MGIVANGLSICAAALGGSYSGNHYIAVGQGSTAYTSGDTALVSQFDKNQIDTNDFNTAEQVTMVANWSPTDISGCVLKEFGVSTAGNVLLNREVLAGSLVFDGEQELQIQQTIQFKI